MKEEERTYEDQIQGVEFKTREDAEKATSNAGWQDDFDGMNCDPCLGWDGHSRRCDCGNRRVLWDIEQQSDGKWTATARAW